METQWTKTACREIEEAMSLEKQLEEAFQFPTQDIGNSSSSSKSRATSQIRSDVNSPIPSEFEEPLPVNVETANQPAAAFDAEEEAADEQSPIDGDGEFGFQPLQAVSEEANKSHLQILGARTSKDPSSASGQTLKRF